MQYYPYVCTVQCHSALRGSAFEQNSGQLGDRVLHLLLCCADNETQMFMDFSSLIFLMGVSDLLQTVLQTEWKL